MLTAQISKQDELTIHVIINYWKWNTHKDIKNPHNVIHIISNIIIVTFYGFLRETGEWFMTVDWDLKKEFLAMLTDCINVLHFLFYFSNARTLLYKT